MARPSIASPQDTCQWMASGRSVHNRKGFFEKNALGIYSLNNVTAKRNADGSVTMQFGGCDTNTVNCVPTSPGWSYLVRMYRPRTEILNGTWKFPDATPVT